MGSCISKCRPKKSSSKSQEACNNFVQDKLVIISQAPTSPINPAASSTKTFYPSPSPPSSTSSFSSFSCTSNKTSISCSSSSASSSSVFSSKDRSFSNEFLWSCVKENPHIIHVDPIKASPRNSKIHAQDSPAKSSVVAPARQSIPQRVVGSAAQKRARASSPTVTRQKSFRKEPAERPNSAYLLPNRTVQRSPSPSRRFNGDNCRNVMTNTPKESCCKRSVGSKTTSVSPVLSSVWEENLRAASPNNNSSRHNLYLKNREMCNKKIGTKIDGVAIGEVLSSLDIDSLQIEDIDNPHISLDCFIFL